MQNNRPILDGDVEDAPDITAEVHQLASERHDDRGFDGTLHRASTELGIEAVLHQVIDDARLEANADTAPYEAFAQDRRFEQLARDRTHAAFIEIGERHHVVDAVDQLGTK